MSGRCVHQRADRDAGRGAPRRGRGRGGWARRRGRSRVAARPGRRGSGRGLPGARRGGAPHRRAGEHAHPTPRRAVAGDPGGARARCQLVGAGITTVLDGLAIGYLVDTGQRPARSRRRSSRRSAPPGRPASSAPSTYLHMRCEVSTELVVPGLRAVRRRSAGPARLADGSHAGPAAVRQRREVPRVQPGALRAHRRSARRADRAPARGAGPLRGRPPGGHHRALPQARPPGGEPRRRHRRARGRSGAGGRGHRGVPDHPARPRARPRTPTGSPFWRAPRTSCAVIPTRATSRPPSWPRAAGSTSSPRTTCRRACCTGRSCSISSTE